MLGAKVMVMPTEWMSWDIAGGLFIDREGALVLEVLMDRCPC